MSERESFDDPDFELDDLLDEALPGSVKDVTVRGRAATAYSISAQDPGPVAWPSLFWAEGDLAFWIWGEGLDETAVQMVAESLRPATSEEHVALVQGQRCGS